jgi:hypothetical protein
LPRSAGLRAASRWSRRNDRTAGRGAGELSVVGRFTDGTDWTRLTTVDAGTGSVVRAVDPSSQITSAVPVHRGSTVAAGA